VLDRDDHVRVYVEGQRVELRPTFGDFARAMAELARAVSAAAWADGVSHGEVLSNPASSLYRRPDRESVARGCPESPGDDPERATASPQVRS